MIRHRRTDGRIIGRLACLVGVVASVLVTAAAATPAAASSSWEVTSLTSSPGNGTAIADPTDLSCWSVGNCLAVGWNFDNYSVSKPWIAKETAGVWGQASEVSFPQFPDGGDFQAVSCPTSSWCTLVGQGGDGSVLNPWFSVTYSHGTWGTPVDLPTTSNFSVGTNDSGGHWLSCYAVGYCTVVGHMTVGSIDAGDYGTAGAALTETDGTWGSPTALGFPSDAGDTFPSESLRAVSCPGLGNCVAAGVYDRIDAEGYSDTSVYLVTEASGVWGSPVGDIVTGDYTKGWGSVQVNAVSCTDISDCGLVGDYYLNNQNEHFYAVDETAGSWGGLETLNDPTGTSSDDHILTDISCATAGNCTAVGWYGPTSGIAGDVAITETGGIWGDTLDVSDRVPVAGTAPLLAAVSCPRRTTCEALGEYADAFGTRQAMAVTGTGLVPPSPTVTGVVPASGPVAGGTAITVVGSGFVPGFTRVLIDQGVGVPPVEATNVNVVTPYELTATTPPGLAGAYNLRVLTSGGESRTSSANKFRYIPPPPTVTGVSPNSGPTAGGTDITVTGTNFVAPLKVFIGQGAGQPSVQATNVTVVSPTEITATTPAGTAGTFALHVRTTGGTSAPNTADRFAYVPPPPTVTGVSPNSGPTAGGSDITVTGTNFVGRLTVFIGQGAGQPSVRATNITVVSPTEITATTPAGTAGTFALHVKTSGGTSPANAVDRFTYE